MASHSSNRAAVRVGSWPIPQIVRQMLLVPEGVLLLVLLAIHLLTGGSGFTALLGLALVVCFVARSALLVAARQALRGAQYPLAERLLRVALLLHPWSADALALRGALFLATGRPEAADLVLRRAIALFPDHGSLHAALSSALLDQGRITEARWEALRTLSLDPGCAAAYLHLAQAEQRLGVPLLTIEQHLRAGLEICHDAASEAALRVALSAVLLALGHQGESRLAVQGVEALVAHCTPCERAALLFQLGEVRRAQGDQEAARGHFQASEQLDPHGRYAAAAWRAARC